MMATTKTQVTMMVSSAPPPIPAVTGVVVA
jgi:hypothetical protein